MKTDPGWIARVKRSPGGSLAIGLLLLLLIAAALTAVEAVWTRLAPPAPASAALDAERGEPLEPIIPEVSTPDSVTISIKYGRGRTTIHVESPEKAERLESCILAGIDQAFRERTGDPDSARGWLARRRQRQRGEAKLQRVVDACMDIPAVPEIPPGPAGARHGGAYAAGVRNAQIAQPHTSRPQRT